MVFFLLIYFIFRGSHLGLCERFFLLLSSWMVDLCRGSILHYNLSLVCSDSLSRGLLWDLLFFLKFFLYSFFSLWAFHILLHWLLVLHICLKITTQTLHQLISFIFVKLNTEIILYRKNNYNQYLRIRELIRTSLMKPSYMQSNDNKMNELYIS